MRVSRLLLSAILYLFVSLNASGQVNLNQGLIAYYPFNGDANDASGNNNNGIVQNGVQLTSDRYGNPNSAYNFDGIDDYIRVPYSSSLNASTGLSVTAFFYPTQSTVQTIVGKISYAGGIGTQFQVGIGFSAYPGVFYGLNPPTTGCNNQISLNNAYINTGSFALNQWNCLVATYESGVQKIYLNGALIQTNNTSFTNLNQCTNSDIQIGSWWSVDPQRYKGKIDDVRLYNRALNEQEVAALCVLPASAQPGFIAPDTVCVNSPVSITNTSTGTSTYYWNFCSANVGSVVPAAVNLGNPGGLSQPVFMDIAQENGNFYGFVVNHIPGGIVRLDFGNSLLNPPIAVPLGNPSNAMNANYGNEGIQIVKSNGNWYGIIVGGNPASSTTPRLVTVKFGPNLNNPSPTAVNWGNVGNMLEPIDLHVFQESGVWYGFTVNAVSNTITRFNFTNSFENAPTGTNIGNIGNLNYPDGIYAINDNGFWRVFITNGAVNSSITRLDFGSTLLNTPTGTNMGNLGGAIASPRDITILNYCGQSVGFVTNAFGTLSRLNFSSLSSIPTATNLGNLGNLNFPHSLSKLFRVGNDIYSFITNVQNNTITRLRFTGCTNSSLPGSNLQTPPTISYNVPGTYNINLTVDDGLPTQSAYCKQIVVVNLPHAPTQSLSICPQATKKIGSSIKPATYLWSTGATSDSITVSAAGTYWVESSKYGCTVRDSFIVTTLSSNPPDFSFQQDLCLPKSIQFGSVITGFQSFTWDFGNNQTNNTSQNPAINYSNFGSYNVKLKVLHNNGCLDSIVKSIDVVNLQDNSLLINSDTSICTGDSVLLKTNGQFPSYCWQSSTGQVPAGLTGYVTPSVPTTYSFTTRVLGPNLVVNSDFSSGNTAFTSEYGYNATNFILGEYGINNSPAAWNPSFSNCTEHTTGTGNMMVVNGASGGNAIVWSQTVNVSPNTNYRFSTWIASLQTTNPASLQFSINGGQLGTVINGPATTCQWSEYGITWNSGNKTTAVLSIVNKNTTTGGNDYALDDIYFGTSLTRMDSVHVNLMGICDSIDISGIDKICSAADTISYAIYKAANCLQTYSILVDNNYAEVVSQTASTVKIRFKQDGQTTVKLVYADNCKTIADSINVDIKFSPASINLGPDVTTCRDTSFLLNAAPGFASYVWQDGSTSGSFQVNVPGTYHIMAQNYCGLQIKDTVLYIKSAVVPFAYNPATVVVCSGDSVQFSASGGNQYQWEPSVYFSAPAASVTKGIVSTSQVYTLHITDAVCNRDTMINIPVTASSQADIKVTKTNDVSCSNDTAVLKATGGVSYSWMPNNYIVRTSSSQITVRPPQSITYYVTGIDALGCKGQDSITVEFRNEGDQRLFIPNAFSPNGDGLNDVFRPTFIGPAAKYQFSIYNRWGQLVFMSKVPGVGWNGVFQSKEQPGGVYVYYITAEGGCNGKFEEKGTFVLMR